MVTMRLCELALEAGIPAGVLNVVHGGEAGGQRASATTRTSRRSRFVGSTKVGTHVYNRATLAGKRAQCMMGAKNHAIVMPDANKEQTLNALAGAGFGAAGQRCMAVSVAVLVGDAQQVGARPGREGARRSRSAPAPRRASDVGPLVSCAALRPRQRPDRTRRGRRRHAGARRPQAHGARLREGQLRRPDGVRRREARHDDLRRRRSSARCCAWPTPTTHRRGDRADQRQPERQRHGDLHAVGRRGAPLPGRHRRRPGRHQRADPGAGADVLVHRLARFEARRPGPVRQAGRSCSTRRPRPSRRAGSTTAPSRTASTRPSASSKLVRMDFELSEEQRAFAQTAREFAEPSSRRMRRSWDAEAISRRRPSPRPASSASAGCMRPSASAAWRCRASMRRWCSRRWPRPCPSTTAFITIHNMATWMVAHFARPDVAAHWGPTLTSGRKLASYCLTEPGAGSDAASLQDARRARGRRATSSTAARPSSPAPAPPTCWCVMARTGGGGRGRHLGLRWWRPKRRASATARRSTRWAGTASPPAPSIFDDVRVPAEHLLGRKARASDCDEGLDGGRINIATCSVGAAQGALDAAQRYLHERQQFGKPLADFQALQFKLADMATELVAARQMVRLAASQARRRPCRRERLLRDGQALRHRRRLQGLQRGAADARRLWLPAASIPLER